VRPSDRHLCSISLATVLDAPPLFVTTSRPAGGVRAFSARAATAMRSAPRARARPRCPSTKRGGEFKQRHPRGARVAPNPPPPPPLPQAAARPLCLPLRTSRGRGCSSAKHARRLTRWHPRVPAGCCASGAVRAGVTLRRRADSAVETCSSLPLSYLPCSHSLCVLLTNRNWAHLCIHARDYIEPQQH